MSELYNSLQRVIKSSECDEDGNELALNKSEDEELFEGKRLLLVDDVDINREIATVLLEMHGFIVEQAINGKEAVEKVAAAEAGYYSVVLMDIQMPIMSGYDASRAIRALDDKDKAAVPIIAMTANAFEEDKKNALESGMNAHVAKPIDEKNLMSVLGKILGGE